MTSNVTPPTPEQKSETEHAIQLIMDLYVKHPEISCSIWISAFSALIVGSYVQSGINYHDFTNDILDMMAFYRKSWPDE